MFISCFTGSSFSESMRVTTAAVIHSSGRILLVKRPPGGDLSECWELPGGKVDSGESERDALKRELREELGADGSVHEQLGSAHFVHHGEEFEVRAFRVVLDESQIRLSEHSELRWCTPEEALTLQLAPSDFDLLRSLEIR